MNIYYCDVCGKRLELEACVEQANEPRRFCKICAPPLTKDIKSSRINIPAAIPPVAKQKANAQVIKPTPKPREPFYIWVAMAAAGLAGLMSGVFLISQPHAQTLSAQSIRSEMEKTSAAASPRIEKVEFGQKPEIASNPTIALTSGVSAQTDTKAKDDPPRRSVPDVPQSTKVFEAPQSRTPATQVVTQPVPLNLPASASVPIPQNEPARKSEQAAYLVNLWLLVRDRNLEGAHQWISKTLADPRFAAFRADLDLDNALIDLAVKAGQSVEDGAVKLLDGRTFTLRMKNGKEVVVGKESKSIIVRINGHVIDLEQNLGGGTASFKIRMDSLTPETCIALSELELANQPDGYLALAAARFPSAMHNPKDEFFGSWMMRASKTSSESAKLKRLKTWMQIEQLENSAQSAFNAIAPAINGGDAEKAQALLDSFNTQYADTAFATQKKAVSDELRDRIQSLMRKPGLWATYWSARDESHRFQSIVFSRVEPETYDGLIVERLPSHNIKPDCFDLRYEGVLRLPKDGSYAFTVEADDKIRIWIDDKKVAESPSVKSVDLTAGDHVLKIEYSNYQGGGIFKVWCRPPGSDTTSRLPADWLWHRQNQVTALSAQ